MYEFDQFLDDGEDDIFFNEEVLKVADSQLLLVEPNFTSPHTTKSADKGRDADNFPRPPVQLSPEKSLGYEFRPHEEEDDLCTFQEQRKSSPTITTNHRSTEKDSGSYQNLHTVATTYRESPSTNLTRKRKFPGPAGIFADESETSCSKKLSLSTESSSSTRVTDLSTIGVEVSSLWKDVVAKLAAQEPVFVTYNLGWVRAQTQFIFHAPVLVLQLNSINLSGPNAVAHFSDRFGEIRASLQSELTKMYCHLLTPGSILVFKKVNVMGSKFPISHTFHLALTLRSLLSIHYLADGIVQSVVHQALDKSEIAQIVETVQIKLSSVPSSEAEEEFPALSTSICPGSGQNNLLARLPRPSLVTNKFPIPESTTHVTSKNFTFKSPEALIPNSSSVAPATSVLSSSFSRSTSASLQLTSKFQEQNTLSPVDNPTGNKTPRAPTAVKGFPETFFDGLDESTFFDEF